MINIDIKTIRQHLLEQREKLKTQYYQKPNPNWLLNKWTGVVDDVLTKIWKEFDFNDKISLIAVGGYGRAELFPFSDIDLLILIDKELSTECLTKIESLIGLFWDIGLEVGHSVRTLDECLEVAQEDITIATTLIDSRLVIGQPNHLEGLRKGLFHTLDLNQFILGKIKEQKDRHHKHNDTAFNLEPHIKESPGGIRDLHTIIWLSWGAGYGNTWQDLVTAGILFEQEITKIKSLIKYLANLRIRLHYLAKRREDRLLFDYQNQLANELGFKDKENHRASEMMMQQYYQTAKSVLLINTIIIEQVKAQFSKTQETEKQQRLSDHFIRQDDLLGTTPENLFSTQPDLIFDGFLMLQKYPKLRGFTPTAIRDLWRAQKLIDHQFRINPHNQEVFMDILRQPLRTAEVLKRMNYFGILGRYIPSFGKIEGQMQHDLFHVYTVDEHILRVLTNLRRFAVPQYDHEFPFCSILMRQFDRVDLLYIAALFHDIAKGRGGDHSLLGCEDAQEFCTTHGLSKYDTNFVSWLVESHLRMSSVAQKQDLSDPEVIEKFALSVKDKRHLTALYLLTVADVRGTSPKVWNAWKAKLLEDLYRLTERYFDGHQTDIDTEIEEKKQRVLNTLKHYGLLDSSQIKLWRIVDPFYFQRYDEKEITWHARSLQGVIDSTKPIVKARLSPLGEGIQVLIYSPDQTALFARICGYFEKISYTIQEAKIHTSLNGYALDTFQIVHKSEENDHYRHVIKRIEEELQTRLIQQSSLEEPLNSRISRHLQHFPIEVMVHFGDRERHHDRSLTIVAGDRPGLLYRIARVLVGHRINLKSARINTLGERVEDVFILDDTGLEQTGQRENIRNELIQALS
ncbi:[protein-PII] uridylyltransferase [Ferrovum sp. PN-J185]|uniref:[protein-PII] uridylyltransferase n=1 Tax=Ferrovum sp. PN-J185 TaxID=1356306 RepID=UPI000792F7AF|nr:[protein-PII] uridylyltransferase [Ferrovum sp. PN-J185]KXW56301.1 bifunctional uridylyltransferase/uridylyl-removing enzyme [Ferrovum sp. PN-J185]MCC6069025.1 [protein-PII] uridylyltransferase [Ferrovum sp. PN-J185]MDE1890995.1 [protein-PII] uridylyltransferase [Betaproteobacteria bacterium]MDE2055693.1 [protein-PII] uridylyltransferase [Betaproteobacteria bacterium]